MHVIDGMAYLAYSWESSSDFLLMTIMLPGWEPSRDCAYLSPSVRFEKSLTFFLTYDGSPISGTSSKLKAFLLCHNKPILFVSRVTRTD